MTKRNQNVQSTDYSLELINMSPFLLQLLAKIYASQHTAAVLVDMDKIIDIYEVNSKNASTKRAKLIQKYAIITELVLKGGFVLYCLGGGIYLLNPFYSYFWQNRVIPLLPVYMPFVDENTKTGFITLSALHISLIILTILGSACVDFMFIMLIVNMPVLSTICGDNVRELNDILNGKKVNLTLANAKLKNIFLIHSEIFEYVRYIFFHLIQMN